MGNAGSTPGSRTRGRSGRRRLRYGAGPGARAQPHRASGAPSVHSPRPGGTWPPQVRNGAGAGSGTWGDAAPFPRDVAAPPHPAPKQRSLGTWLEDGGEVGDSGPGSTPPRSIPGMGEIKHREGAGAAGKTKPLAGKSTPSGFPGTASCLAPSPSPAAGPGPALLLQVPPGPFRWAGGSPPSPPLAAR